jgi:phosphodiesterase/alkaline phosphatase D-like protein
MSHRRGIDLRAGFRPLVVPMVAVLLAFAPGAAAQADTGFGHLRQFNETVLSPTGVAVDQASGNVYVAARNNAEAYEVFAFDPSTGEPISLPHPIDGKATPQESFSELAGVAVNQATHDIYVLDSGRQEIDEFEADGTYLAQFGGPGEEPGTFPAGDRLAGIAIDSTTGDVLVSNESNDVITRFSATGGYVSQFGRPGSGDGQFSGPTGVALDSHGAVYVADPGNSRVEKLGPTGGFLATLPAASPMAVAVDPANDHVFVGDAGSSGVPGEYHILEYSSSGTLLDDFGYSFINRSVGMAFGDLNDELYVADRENNDISVFGQTTLPAASTGAASNLGTTTATLSGTLNPEGTEAHYYFQYGTTTEYGSESPARPGEPATGTSNVNASTTLTELEANTTYHYRLVATNPAGSTYGQDQTLTTTQAPPTITEETGTATSATEATLSGGILPGNLDTTYHFDYGTSPTTYEASVPIPDGEAGASPTSVSQAIVGLQPDTTYYFRLVATNNANGSPSTTYGEQATFATPPPPPAVASLAATDITTTSATLSGTIGRAGSATEYIFEYESSCFAGLPFYYSFLCSPSPISGSEGTVGAGTGDETVTTLFTGLNPNTRYFYDVVGTNAGGTAHGEPREFTTLPLPPSITNRGVGEISQSTALIFGAIKPNGADTTYTVEYGVSSAYGAATPAAPVPTGSTATEAKDVATELQGLRANTTYHYRLVATNPGGTTNGEDGAFTTTTPEAYPVAPTATTGTTASVTSTTASLTGTVTPHGSATTYRVEYGTTVFYGSESAPGDAGSGSGQQAVAQVLSGLQSSTLYHWRLVASNQAGTSYGEDATFATQAAPMVAPGPTTTTTPTTKPAATKPKAPTKAQALARALKRCKQYKKKNKRRACERRARTKYEAKSKPQKSAKRASSDGKASA